MSNKTFPNYSVYSGKIEKDEGESSLIRIEEDEFAGTIFSFLDIQLNEDLLSYNINFVSLKYKNKEYLEDAPFIVTGKQIRVFRDLLRP